MRKIVGALFDGGFVVFGFKNLDAMRHVSFYRKQSFGTVDERCSNGIGIRMFDVEAAEPRAI